ncbi:hypothetical protein [Roseibium sp.]|uniref:hypothetical protein n=1 Tax=Roseibium sp. TaxID=1936156 RepID=UPI003A9702F7
MPATIERPPAANVVAHATEYPPDRQRQGHRGSEEDRRESRAERQDDHAPKLSGSADAVVIVHVEEDHRLDGVSAYTHLGEQARLALNQRAATASLSGQSTTSPDPHTPGEIREAYEEHGGELEHHEVNVAT